MEKQVSLIVSELRRIANALEKMNDIKKEKDKANLKGILSDGEIEYLIATQKKKK